MAGEQQNTEGQAEDQNKKSYIGFQDLLVGGLLLGLSPWALLAYPLYASLLPGPRERHKNTFTDLGGALRSIPQRVGNFFRGVGTFFSELRAGFSRGYNHETVQDKRFPAKVVKGVVETAKAIPQATTASGPPNENSTGIVEGLGTIGALEGATELAVGNPLGAGVEVIGVAESLQHGPASALEEPQAGAGIVDPAQTLELQDQMEQLLTEIAALRDQLQAQPMPAQMEGQLSSETEHPFTVIDQEWVKFPSGLDWGLDTDQEVSQENNTEKVIAVTEKKQEANLTAGSTFEGGKKGSNHLGEKPRRSKRKRRAHREEQREVSQEVSNSAVARLQSRDGLTALAAAPGSKTPPSDKTTSEGKSKDHRKTKRELERKNGRMPSEDRKKSSRDNSKRTSGRSSRSKSAQRRSSRRLGM